MELTKNSGKKLKGTFRSLIAKAKTGDRIVLYEGPVISLRTHKNGIAVFDGNTWLINATIVWSKPTKLEKKDLFFFVNFGIGNRLELSYWDTPQFSTMIYKSHSPLNVYCHPSGVIVREDIGKRSKITFVVIKRPHQLK